LWRIFCPSVGGIAAITKVNTHGGGGIGDFPDQISPFIFERDFEATGLENGLASKLMLGAGCCGWCGRWVPHFSSLYAKKKMEMRKKERVPPASRHPHRPQVSVGNG
jgi:hypothetical protein